LHGPADQAVTRLNEVLQREPRNAHAYHARGAAHARRGNYQRAVADFTQALQLDPQGNLTRYNRGLAYVQSGELDKAVADFDSELQIHPKHVLIRLDRAAVHERLGAHERTVADLTEVVQQDSPNPAVYRALAWLLATSPAVSVRDGKKAKGYASKACALTGWKNAGYLDTLATACAECAEFDEAIEWEKKAVELARPDEKAKFQHRLDLFQAKQPYRQEPPLCPK
jgi:tetratricopeptide (TPR) repeat protein